MLKKTIISHLVKPEDLQHHGTLFAGRMAEWLVEACFIAACQFVGKPEDVVCVKVHGISFKKPINDGNIIEIRARVAYVGTTSITVYGRTFNSQEQIPSVLGMVTFATADRQGKSCAHGLSLSEEYIAKHRNIYDMALKVRKSE